MRSPRTVLAVVLAAVLVAFLGVHHLDAPRPAVPGVPVVPVGWNSWNAYGCDVDERRIERAADAMVTSGMRDAGYSYVEIDDCWVAATRAADGRLQADPTRFPDGIAALAAYVHARGLKLGLYTSATSKTCAQRAGSWPGATGSEGHEALDAATFAGWGVDLVKDDWCAGTMAAGVQRSMFEAFRDGIRAAGRPMVLMINPNSGITTSVPGIHEDWAGVATTVRITNDVTPVWTTSIGPLGYQGVGDVVAAAESAVAQGWSTLVRPDADMLETGAEALSPAEQRTQLGMLAVLGLPLIAGDDPTAMSSLTRSLLSNPRLVTLATDPTAPPARLPDASGLHLWTRQTAAGLVLALYNPGDEPVTVSPATFVADPGVDLWTNEPTTSAVTVAPHDTLLLVTTSAAGAG